MRLLEVNINKNKCFANLLYRDIIRSYSYSKNGYDGLVGTKKGRNKRDLELWKEGTRDTWNYERKEQEIFGTKKGRNKRYMKLWKEGTRKHPERRLTVPYRMFHSLIYM